MEFTIKAFDTKKDFNGKKKFFSKTETSKKKALSYVEILRETEEFYGVIVTSADKSFNETIIFE